MASTVWRGYITFGLISIPVRLFRAARAERVSFRRLYRADAPSQSSRRTRELEEDEDPDRSAEASERIISDIPKARRAAAFEAPPIAPAASVLAPIQQVSVQKGSEDVVPERSVVKGYEYEKDRYVVVEKEELKSIAPKTATEMQIEEFVNLSEVDPVYFETSYYVVPEEAGQKAYSLLYRSLQLTGLVAVAQFAMHSREHVVILRPATKGLIAHTMFFSSEVRADEEYAADTRTVTQRELDLAQTLIHSLAGPFQPEKYRDTYREKLEEIIAKKVAGQPVVIAEKPSRAASVFDITDALQKSLAALKKPAASEGQPRKPAQSTATTAKKTSRAAGRK